MMDFSEYLLEPLREDGELPEPYVANAVATRLIGLTRRRLGRDTADSPRHT